MTSSPPLSKTGIPGAPLCAAPLKTVSAPRIALPPLACDSHLHILGPANQYPYASERIYTPPDCLLSDYEQAKQVLGIERCVLVQPSVYGTDNRVLLDALGQMGNAARGIVVLGEDVTASQIGELSAQRVVGVRVNLVDVKDASGKLPVEQLQRLADRVGPLGWHLELLMHVDEHPNLYESLRDLGVQIVFGHMGYMNRGASHRSEGMAGMVALMRSGRAWTKLTAPYRFDDGPDYLKARVTAQWLIAQCPDRLVWGSDWPHVMVSKARMPDDGDLINDALEWANNDVLRRAIFSANAEHLYGW